MSIYDAIGKKREPVYFDITEEAVRAFAESVFATNPIYFDKAAAQAKGFAHIVAPPTFPTSLRSLEPEWYENFDLLRFLHGEQQYTYNKRLVVGERIYCVEMVEAIYVKHGRSGPMTVSELVKKGYNMQDELLFTEKQKLIYLGEVLS